MEERIAAYDARRAQRVLNVERPGEAADALVAEALSELIYAAEAGHPGGKIGCECFWCSAVRKGRRAQRALGK